MSDRGVVAPLLVFGLGAAGAWGAWRYLGPTRSESAKDKGSDKHAPTEGAASPPPPPPPPPRIVEPREERATPPRATEPAHELATTSSRPTAGPHRDQPSRAFDPIFQTFVVPTRIPLAYLRALAWSESRLRPEIPGGLFQIQEATRDDFADRRKMNPASLDLASPATNTAIAADTLVTISANLRRKHPKQRHVRPDWTNPRFVELLTLAWNAGWSEERGVGLVLGYFDKSRYYSGTIADVQKHAHAAGAVAWLYAYPERYAYARVVTTRFFAERDRDALLKASVFEPTGSLRRWAT